MASVTHLPAPRLTTSVPSRLEHQEDREAGFPAGFSDRAVRAIRRSAQRFAQNRKTAQARLW